jgi:alkanesulfonate monooxygenase SsuD/methylene tetrahydromethanopterin reductase-like flavin-dependent oxidoreductase (luciferase family)
MAKMIATLDRLSVGVPFAERATMSDEYVAVMKALWTSEHPL